MGVFFFLQYNIIKLIKLHQFCIALIALIQPQFYSFYFFLTISDSRHVVCSISSACFPESPAAYTTCVNCAGPECGTAATSLPWNVSESIPTLRAAPMEARPPPTARPYPAPTSPTRAREAPKLETFSRSASTPDSSGILPLEFQVIGDSDIRCQTLPSP